MSDTGYRFARRFGVLVAPDQARVWVREDVDGQALLEVRRMLGKRLALEVLSAECFASELRTRYESSTVDAMQKVEELNEELDLAHLAQALPEPEDLLESQDEAPIIRLINALLLEAVKAKASDIHIEPFETRLSIRLRVDGVLREVLEPPKALANALVSRIKVMAKLDIAEKRLPQDGRIGLRLVGRAVDVRVSTLPSGQGERVVLRLLDQQAGRLNLNELGLGAGHLASLEQELRKPHGIFLVTGPTGSGKTTTLYAALMQLNDRSRNILTVEDPIEYYLDGIGQTQINTKAELTFAKGLRAILRQDPDVVMVGEIRDLETVQIAIQASLTGHLVFSTLHTNTAVGAINRLKDMGVEPFLLASTVNAILAQRLVRSLCLNCREPYAVQALEAAQLEVAVGTQIFRAKGCQACHHTGYQGRMGVYELVVIDDALRALIYNGASEQALMQAVHASQPSLKQDAVRRVLLGQTSLEEVLRVAGQR